MERNVRLYYWYRVLGEPLFWGPTLILSLIHLGNMSLAEVYFMESIVLFLMIFMEIPSGALADLIGRKKTSAIGSLCILICIIWFGLMDSPTDAWGANIVCMFGVALRSGSDDALIYDSLHEMGLQETYQQVRGRAEGFRFLVMACSSLCAGFLAQYDLRLPLLLSIPGIAGAVVVALMFTEPKPTEKHTLDRQKEIMALSFLFVANHVKMKWIIGFATLVGVMSKLWFFSYNPYFELVELPLAYYGVVFTIMNTIAWISTTHAHSLERRIKTQYCLVGIIVLLGVPILVMGTWTHILMTTMVFSGSIVRGFITPFINGLMHTYIDSKMRATVLSIRSAVSGLMQFIMLGVFGYMLRVWTLPTCLQMLGASVLILGALSILKYRTIFR